MRYDRKIKYLDYCENGERVRGGGFLKLEVSGNRLKLELTVKGVRGIRELAGDVILCGNSGEEVLGKIQLTEGQGDFRHLCQIDDERGRLAGSAGLTYDELTGIRIPLGEGREITCKWEASGQAAEEAAGKQAAGSVYGQGKARSTGEESAAGGGKAQAAEETAGKQAGTKAARVQAAGTAYGETKARNAEEESAAGGGKAQTVVERQGKAHRKETGKKETEKKETERVPELRGTEAAGSEGSAPHPAEASWDPRQREARMEGSALHRAEAFQDSRQEEAHGEDPAPRRAKESAESGEAVPLLENKWQQLCAIYPHIKPFRDQREYLSIGPEDFVVFSSDSYKAAGNSFMLHGYYNYRHLILTREERRGEVIYYVGVPGNYYEREKQVAIMFGFESFECAQEPAQSSDFGYYMMKVQL
ncbi:MAG: hypothetical protein NC517_10940 [Firmicutes bacterium]|nr:hypothetical protein [Bacillota bacterium]